MIKSTRDILTRDRLLVIAEKPRMAKLVRQRYPNCDVISAENMLDGIAQLSKVRVRAVIAQVDSTQASLTDAVAGLREAAGEQARVLLCCNPDDEPGVRMAAGAGADDYMIYPPESAELDSALGFVRDERNRVTAQPAFGVAELRMITDAVTGLDGEPYALLCKLADLTRTAMGATACRVVADGSAATSGGAAFEPSLVESIRVDNRVIGQISIGPRESGYAAGDVEKLGLYARLVGQLIQAASAQRDWRQRALVDEMSGLYNRRYAIEFLDRVLERSRRERLRVTVLLFDVDDFKTYNDTYGHDAGDEIIRHIGCLFKSHCREHDVVTRYGGDEFLVIFWDADEPRVAGSIHPTDALSVLDRFKAALRDRPCQGIGEDARGQVTISGGLASYPWDAADSRELICRADQALLMAKKAGKNQVLVFGEASPTAPASQSDA